MTELSDLAAERAVLGGIYTYGDEAFLDVYDVIPQATTFTDNTNQALYKCFEYLITKREVKKLDQSSVMAAANELGYGFIFEKPDDLSHAKSIFHTQVLLENVRYWAGHIRKLHIARLLKAQLSSAISDIEKVDGKQSIDAIIAIAENSVFDFSELLHNNSTSDPSLLGEGIREHFRELAKNPIDQVGISSGMKYYDDYIGGGFRRRTVSLLGARTGVGKSLISDNIGIHVSGQLNIPVLYLDTEMVKEDHWHRISANISDIKIRELETGKFAKDKDSTYALKTSIEYVEKMPFYYLNISGKGLEETMSIMRRWIKQKVGLDENGRVKDCLIIYDYIKLMTDESINMSLQEYQVLGFMMTSLHNFAVKHDVPIFALTQLNKDGIDKETTGVVAGSDRVTWLATNVTIFKPKSDEEIAADFGLDNGTHKLVTIKARHGGGTPGGDYLNLVLKGDVTRIEEGIPHSVLKRKRDLKLEREVVEPPELDMGVQYVPV